MLHYALVFLVIAIIAAVFGFGGIAGTAAGIAKILFVVFVVLFLVSLVAGLLIGVIESLSAYWIGAVYKDIVVYSLFLCFLWFRPQGLMGKI